MRAYDLEVVDNGTLSFFQRVLKRVLPVKVKKIFFIATLYAFLLEKCKGNIIEDDYKPIIKEFKGFLNSPKDLEFPLHFVQSIWSDSTLTSLTEEDIRNNRVASDQVLCSMPAWLSYDAPEKILGDAGHVVRAVLEDLGATHA